MRTKKQILASRLNGSRSTGPVSIEGKQKSSRNAEKHGFNSQYVVLTCEDPEVYKRHLQAYFEEWQPETQTECDLVNDIAVCRWRLNRLLAMETAATDMAVDRTREELDQEIRNCDPAGRLVFACRQLNTKTNPAPDFARHEARFRRTIERATDQLRKIQRDRLDLRGAFPPHAPVAPQPPADTKPAPEPRRKQENPRVQKDRRTNPATRKPSGMTTSGTNPTSGFTSSWAPARTRIHTGGRKCDGKPAPNRKTRAHKVRVYSRRGRSVFRLAQSSQLSHTAEPEQSGQGGLRHPVGNAPEISRGLYSRPEHSE